MGKQNSKLKPKHLKDLAKQTAFTENEIKKWYGEFLEKYPSGYINMSEFKDIYAGIYPDGYADEFATHAFRVFDVSNDKKINFREFVTALSVTTRGRAEEKLQWVFSLYDANGNGRISRKEMLEIVGAINKMAEVTSKNPEDQLTTEQRVGRIFEKLDKNTDGSLSKQEFIEGARGDPYFWGLLEDKI